MKYTARKQTNKQNRQQNKTVNSFCGARFNPTAQTLMSSISVINLGSVMLMTMRGEIPVEI